MTNYQPLSVPELLWSVCITGYFIAWCITLVRYEIAGSRLIDHLRHSYKDRWRYLTSIGNFHSGQVNQLRAWRYVRSDEDEGHPRVRDLKNIVRRRGRQMWIVVAGRVSTDLRGSSVTQFVADAVAYPFFCSKNHSFRFSS